VISSICPSKGIYRQGEIHGRGQRFKPEAPRFSERTLTGRAGRIKKTAHQIPDRLARFGYLYIERHLKYCGVEVIAIAEKEPEG
jgi:hypothetical protein